MTHMEDYPYQHRVKSCLRNGQSVVLQAPTGAGKTRAALAPFIETFCDPNRPDDAFPRQCLYTTPMRVLASQFYREHRQLASQDAACKLDIRIQTGDRPEDPQLEGDLVFVTVDQLLSSTLGVPYSLPASRANLNVGAVLGSYLVFDEFHLFPTQAVRTTLQLLRLVRRLTPFVLMTATFSQQMLSAIGELLDAQIVMPSPDEVINIETRSGQQPRKQRMFRVVNDYLSADHVLRTHDRRTLAVFNTVDRTLACYRALRQKGCRALPFDLPELGPIYSRLADDRFVHKDHAIAEGVEIVRRHLTQQSSDGLPWVMLLHSRFERPHRQLKEALLQALWGPEGLAGLEGLSLIVVATQVVEVGLNISAQVLHTEIAPAASVLQRAGRCARYPGEQGQVFIYSAPDDAPYSGAESEVCKRSRQAFNQRHAAVLDFVAEQEVINEAHGDVDRALLQAMKREEGAIWQGIADALTKNDARKRPQLIRDADSRTVIVCDVSDQSPFTFEGFSLWHGTVRGLVEPLRRRCAELGLSWAIRRPIAQNNDAEEGEPDYRWEDVNFSEEVSHSLVFAIHPRLVSYSPEEGLRIGEVSRGDYRSPQAAQRCARPDYAGYQLEPYAAHVAEMWRIFDAGAPSGALAAGRLRRRLAWLKRRFAEQAEDWYLPAELLERAVRLDIVLHDVGKLTEQWQRFAVEYQKAIGEGTPGFLVAHTHYDPANPTHRQAQRQARCYKPATHAGEGALAVAELLYQALDCREGIWRAALTAIARHHSPSLDSAGSYRLHRDAPRLIANILREVGLWKDEWVAQVRVEAPALDLRQCLLKPPPEHPWAWWFQYFIIVRILRLSDGYSQEEVNE
jgi:CRISPR-associated endonuclease/helicase Cas3